MFWKFSVFFLIALFCFQDSTRVHSGKIFPIRTNNCSLQEQQAFLEAVHYVNTLPCTFVHFKVTQTSTNLLRCAHINERFAGLYQPMPKYFRVYLNKMYSHNASFVQNYNVILHELGHVIGLAHSFSKKSVMFGQLLSSKAKLKFDDYELEWLNSLYQVSSGSTCFETPEMVANAFLPILP